MGFLLDTNILLRLAEPNHTVHRMVRDCLKGLLNRKEHLQIVPQNVYEFWTVATRPFENNGLGLSARKAARVIKSAERLFELLPDTPLIYDEWKRIVSKYSVRGLSSHDARIVAAMNVHKVEHLLTFNTDDFQRYDRKEIRVFSPYDLRG